MDITIESIEEAIHFIAATDEEYAAVKAGVKAAEHTMKTIKAEQYLLTKGTVAEREAQAITTEAYRAEVMKMEDLFCMAETLTAKRKSKELMIDVWRTLEATRRRG